MITDRLGTAVALSGAILLACASHALAEDYHGTPDRDVIDERGLDVPNLFVVYGLGGNDQITVLNVNGSGGQGNDTIINAGPFGTAWYQDAPAGIVADLAANTVQDGYGTVDTLRNVRRIAASWHTDRLLGSADADFFMPADGNDFIDGRGGRDRVRFFGASVDDPVITPITGGM